MPESSLDGRLRVTEDGENSAANVVWYGVDANAEPILENGFAVEFDVYLRSGALCEGNPADGTAFVVMATGAADGFATATAPFPDGLGLDTLVGQDNNGGQMGYAGGNIAGRTECHPSFSIEFDAWAGGANEGAGSGCGYHIGLNVNANNDSVQRNAQVGVADEDLPPIFEDPGVHAEIYYDNGKIAVYVTGNGGGKRLKVIEAAIPPLPAGDVLLGFAGGTGGANERAEYDNFVLSRLTTCDEVADTVEIVGCPADASEAPAGEEVTLTANVGGADGDVTYAWTVTGGMIVGAADASAVVIVCDTPGETVTATVTTTDSTCDGAPTATCEYVCGEA